MRHLSTCKSFTIWLSGTVASSMLIFIAPNALAFGEGRATGPDVAEVKEPLTAEAKLQPSTVEAGGTADLHVDMHLAPNYHAYLERFKLVVESPDDLHLADLKITPIVKFMDSVSKSEKEGIEGAAHLQTLIEVPSGFAGGERDLVLKLTYQACTKDHCLFPKTIRLSVPLHIITSVGVSGGAMALRKPAVPLNQQTAAIPLVQNDFNSAIGKGLWAAFLLVFGFGFLTSLTPCIYPMIPITLAVLGARTKNQSHWRNASISVVYVLGLAMTYSTLGVLAASTGSLFGSALSNVYVVSAIALVFVAMGLSMFGLFEVQAPAFIRNRLGAGKTQTGYAGAFATGLVAGIVASPCIGPVLVSVLAYIAQTHNQVLGFFLLFTFSLGMGIPFIALGLSSSLLTRIPRAGPWMESVKIFFGTSMVAMAFYYIHPLYPVWLFRVLVGMAVVLFASQYGAFMPGTHGSWTSLRKGLLLALFAVGCAELIVGVLERQGVQGTSAAVLATTAPSLMPWQNYSEDLLQKAQAAGQPVLIDFSAEWCGACKEMDRSTFIEKSVVDLGKDFALLRIDGTEDSPALQALIARYKVQGFPTYIFFDRGGKQRDDLAVFGFEEAAAFLRRMQAAAMTSHGS